MEMLQMLPLILEYLPFPCTILEENYLGNYDFFFFLTQQAYDLKPFYYTLLDMEFHFYEDDFYVFHICTILIILIST